MNSLPNIFPQEWNQKIQLEGLDFMPFRNLLHFKNEVSKLRQREDRMCEVSYDTALKELISNKSSFDQKHYDKIRNLVRSNLLKRGLITQEVYEHFKYATDGTVVDIDMGKFANGEPDCVITPGVEYIDFFYELYVNISYPGHIGENTIIENMNKMLATVEELQRQHIHIKISLVLPIQRPAKSRDFFSVIPVFSHRDFKTAEVMSSVLNNRLLRKFYFAILEDFYKEELSGSYGSAVMLPKAMNISETFNEVDFFTEIKTSVEGK